MKQKLNPLDKSNLRQVIIDSPDQFRVGFDLAKDIRISGNFKSICVSGMGGSSLPTDLLRIYLNQLAEKGEGIIKKFEIYQNRTHSLPIEAYDNCLNFFSSFSGNTEETIESIKQAIEKRLPSVGITNGGKLAEICQKNNLPCVILPLVIQPRYATGYFFGAMLQILFSCGLIGDFSQNIIGQTDNLKKEMEALEKRGKKLAQKIKGKTPVIHISDRYRGIAMIWKVKINENAKTPAFYNSYPELNHNEMVGYTYPQAKFQIISLLDKNDHPQIVKRMRITADLLRKRGTETEIIEMPDGNIFNTIFYSILLVDWVSYYLALAYGQDPTPVDMVEDLKKLLA